MRPSLPLWVATAALIAAGCARHSVHSVDAVAMAEGQTVTSAPAPFATPPVLSGTPDIATLVAKVGPAVVNVTTEQRVKAHSFGWLFDLDPFGLFGGERRERPDREAPTLRQRAIGSGFIIDSQGHVVTNEHVVDDADSVRVRLADEREFDARVVGRDKRLDVAVLELKGFKGAKDLPVASLGSSDALRVGDYVVAIGNPFGLSHTVTMGIVSAKSRTIGAGPYDDFIQTDASINPGNSGGPLYDLKGQVVGINTAINPSGQGIGFAIPIDAVKDVLPQLLTTGRVARGRLGVAIQSVDEPLLKALGMNRPRGALVGEVERGGPAEKAGLKAGDVILSVDGVDIAHAQELPRLVARHRPGTKVSLRVLHDKTERTVEATLDKLEDKEPDLGRSGQAPSGPQLQGGRDLGIELGEARDGGATVARVGPPADDVLAPGDVILEVNRVPVMNVRDTEQKLRSAPSPVFLKVRHEGVTRYVAIERPK